GQSNATGLGPRPGCSAGFASRTRIERQGTNTCARRPLHFLQIPWRYLASHVALEDGEHRSGSNMSANKSHEQSLFEAALHLKSQSEREAFLQVACATDPELRRRIDQLLAAA